MMQNHVQAAMLSPHDYNPTTRLWVKFGIRGILNHQLYEWFSMAKICTVMVLDNMEDEWTFSNLSFMKSKFRNHLTMHLDLIV
jgi:hypothetical protein